MADKGCSSLADEGKGSQRVGASKTVKHHESAVMADKRWSSQIEVFCDNRLILICAGKDVHKAG